MASDVAGFRASFSNYGSEGVDVAAPGTLIYAGTNYRANSGNRRCTSCKCTLPFGHFVLTGWWQSDDYKSVAFTISIKIVVMFVS